MEFKSLGDLAGVISMMPAVQMADLQRALEKCAKKIEQTAKDEIGHYQQAAGPFPAWAQLAESTEQEKTSKGYQAGAPLLRTGDMRDDITHDVDGLEATIGAKDSEAGKILIYHEFGTSRMPARPVLGPALFRNQEFILKIIGDAAVKGLLEGGKISAAGRLIFNNEALTQHGLFKI